MLQQFKLMVISSPTDLPGEISNIIQLFENGLQHFHLRKPMWEPWQAEEFLRAIPAIYHPHIVLHSNFLFTNKFPLMGIHLNEENKKNLHLFEKYKVVSGAFHTIEEIRENTVPYRYIFLSPVFDSISKPGYQSTFEPKQLQLDLKELRSRRNQPPAIIALGGISVDNIELTRQLGFSGAAVIGSVWNEVHPLKAFLVLQRCIPL